MQDAASVTLHASTVAAPDLRPGQSGWRALVIQGRSGSGKSSLALALMALGARLVADDRTIIDRDGTDLIARCPPPIAGLIEARGLGVLSAPIIETAPVAAFLDLDRMETDRLPPLRSQSALGIARPLLHNSASQHFAAALLHYLSYGRKD
ncbi:HPr kinase/phosphorylase [Cognatishimia sp. F0-27]|uniref:HPr kinase/phosphorylase n=1 Tax=Cognatishimia sp. F0-27 TaxID=2816855 RepID=UPI001D0C073D|nr:serine kinase [Cognatishimia sp. F0-27]MCC1491119.1 serine kinase [Cognatishimia sp. F0-27]